MSKRWTAPQDEENKWIRGLLYSPGTQMTNVIELNSDQRREKATQTQKNVHDRS